MRTLTPTSPDSPAVDLDSVHDIHLMAIAGTGMGALARLLQQAGYSVRGSDAKVWPPISDLLREAEIPWREGFVPEHLEPAPDLVIVGNVVRRENPQAAAMRERRLPHLSFPEALGALFLAERTSLVVAGTHGKTTTSTLLAWVLREAGLDPSFLIGGVGRNLGDAAHLGGGDLFVVEGDEYDTAYFDKGPKFLHYQPHGLILTSMEFDHADIYRDDTHYRSAFERLMKLVPGRGVVVAWAGDPAVVEVALQARAPTWTYAARPGVDALFRAESIRVEDGRARFEVYRAGERMGEVELGTPGVHNVENALAVIALGTFLGLELDTMAPALATFRGVRRRQELIGEAGGIRVVDDFAHHPTAVRETLEALRVTYPQARLWAVFEPRSNTARRNIYQAAYAEAFGAADRVVVSAPPPHPDPIPEAERFDPERLARDLEAKGIWARHLPDPGAILEALCGWLEPGDVVVSLSNGAFGGLPARLLETLEARG